ncbi:IclR family transcriptional regulator [Gulosibacter chungangensis]|uniref:IclR family transcriptional regulator n=1 Tax=Gulosibacter chungangensis TaxID=979746 RepID=A0A7J5B8T2_9MICO|nr:IclR family transcriptional regulator [Gulosibacter chungangensis]KAB1641688.1 IclR family transcriptional regulator [Gulosibacter chungangensis]
MTSKPAAPNLVKSAARALEVVELLAKSGPMTFQEVLDALGLPRSSAHGLLGTLEATGWLEFSARDKTYSLGLKAWEVGQRYDGHRVLSDVAPPIMKALTKVTGETVQLAILDGAENVYVEISPSPNPMRLASSVGMRLPAHATGIGKALLATLDDAEVRERLSGVEMTPYTSHTLTTIDSIITEVNGGRSAGYFIEDEEYIEGSCCVAMTVATPRELGLSVAMSITMPSIRAKEDWPGSMVAPLRESCAQLRGTLGLD